MTFRATGQVLDILGVCATITVCTLYVTKATAQTQAESNASPIYGITIPVEYRNWKVISVAQVGAPVNVMRIKLGNDLLRLGSMRKRITSSARRPNDKASRPRR
jgi:hypothetical protein